jgi:radical SAM superfamily enzyme YgiQ (UPF0313 family)
MTRPGETGAIRKPDSAAIRVALVYPNTYRLGMANLGFQTLYWYLNTRKDFAAERFFVSESASIRGRGRHPPRAEESGRSLRDFQVVAFSLPFESDYPAVPRMLLDAGIPPLARDRRRSDPLVLGGGVSVSMNPEPLAPFLDLCFIGEVEIIEDPAESGSSRSGELLPVADRHSSAADIFFSRLREVVRGPSVQVGNRQEICKLFRDIPSVYVPSGYRFVFAENGAIQEIIPQTGFPEKVKAAKRISPGSRVPVSVLSSAETEFGENVLVEINRGCRRRCRFCAAGWIHHPVRYTPYDEFRHEVEPAIESGSAVGMIGSDLAGHPHLEDILTKIVNQGGKFSLSSIRPEGLSPGIIRLMARTGQKTATLAPEVASPRMKRVIGKRIPAERFYELVAELVAAGIPNVRFYFMIGLPTETEDDVQAIVDFAKEARGVFVQASRPRGAIGRLSFQVNPFVPKPWTPFQWAAMFSERDLHKRLKMIRDGLRRERNVVVRAESARQALEQGYLSRGDRRIAEVLLRGAEQGVRFAGGRGSGADRVGISVHRERFGNEVFPWDVTDHGIRKETLWKIYTAATGR